VADRPLGEEEALSDFGIAQSFSHKFEDLELARGQASRVLLGGGTRTPRQTPHTALSQLPRKDCRRGPGTQSM
jgi:hypothetical protein